MAFTPGPWQWRHLEHDDRLPVCCLEGDLHGGRAAVLRIKMELDPQGKLEAYLDSDEPDNLRLISAAPELLDACGLVLHGLENITTEDFFQGRLESLRDLLAAAVARAEGREQQPAPAAKAR